MDLNTTVRNIKSLKIQGATNVNKAALKAFGSHASKVKAKTPESFFREMSKAKVKLSTSRPTEPEMRNFLNFVYYNLKESKLADVKKLKKEAKRLANVALKKRQDAFEKLVKYGSNLVQKNSIVYTHCHSSSVTKILAKAHKKKKFIVHNTETRPRYQGRLTAIELAKLRIPVYHFVDSAMRLALKKADMVMIGADSITTTKVLNKIGSELAVEIANRYDVPVYVCASSWKFSPKTVLGFEEVVEERSPKEVWSKPPKGVKIMNYAFERINLDLITGIVSDLGVLKPEVFIQQAMKRHPWATKV